MRRWLINQGRLIKLLVLRFALVGGAQKEFTLLLVQLMQFLLFPMAAGLVVQLKLVGVGARLVAVSSLCFMPGWLFVSEHVFKIWA